MKKFICVFSTLLVVLVSCSKSEDASVSPIVNSNLILLKSGTINGVLSNFTYTGTMLNDITKGTKKDTYTYTGDLITRIQKSDGATVNTITDYSYTNGNLITKIQDRPTDTYKLKTTYTYQTNGTVTYISVNVDKNTAVESPNASGTITLLNGNIVKDYSIANGSPSTGAITHNVDYEYDLKNNPFSNVKGFNKLFLNETERFSKNNLTKTTVYTQYTGYQGTSVENSENTYNSDGFPTQRIDRDVNNVTINTIQYFY